MKCKRYLLHIIYLLLIVFLLGACAAPPTTTILDAPEATATPEPPTETPTLLPSTKTHTPAPSTATLTSIPPTTVPTETPIVSVGRDIDIELPEGDIERGKLQVLDRGCWHCHGFGEGPYFYPEAGTPGIGDRAEVRFLQDDYMGNATSAEQYLFESIVKPSAYVVEGFAAGTMPYQFGSIMTAQDSRM